MVQAACDGVDIFCVRLRRAPTTPRSAMVQAACGGVDIFCARLRRAQKIVDISAGAEGAHGNGIEQPC